MQDQNLLPPNEPISKTMLDANLGALYNAQAEFFQEAKDSLSILNIIIITEMIFAIVLPIVACLLVLFASGLIGGAINRILENIR
jgi:hypothetical protein